ncbi:MAG: alpha/beta fold hydrolase [Acidimicrobiia bacterium]
MTDTTSVAERWTSRSGPRIRYLDNAPAAATGLPVLLSPGFTDFADEYAEVLEFFSPRRMLVVEVRGRGRSEAPHSGYRASDHAADLQAVLDEEGIDRFHLMTFSRGTTWGLDLVLDDPARVASVSIGDYAARELALARDLAGQVMEARFRGRPMAERVEAHVISELFGASRERDLFGALAATGLPVMVATGTEDGCMLDAAGVQEYRDRIPGVEIVVIEGAAHDLFRPDRLAYPRAVQQFIQRRAPGT